MSRSCVQCGANLSRYNKGNICFCHQPRTTEFIHHVDDPDEFLIPINLIKGVGSTAEPEKAPNVLSIYENINKPHLMEAL